MMLLKPVEHILQRRILGKKDNGRAHDVSDFHDRGLLSPLRGEAVAGCLATG